MLLPCSVVALNLGGRRNDEIVLELDQWWVFTLTVNDRKFLGAYVMV